MHHPTDRIAHTTAFVTPVVEHWLEREIMLQRDLVLMVAPSVFILHLCFKRYWRHFHIRQYLKILKSLVYLFFYLFIYLYLFIYVCLFICLFIYLFIYLFQI